ncbi:hypothetical protein CR513_27551, partial [Mucuna pruriens]
MEMYIKPTQYNIWGTTTYGDKVVNKPNKVYTQDDYNTLQFNARGRYIITYALPKSEYNKFYIYKIAKEMSDAIQITYGSTNVQLQKIVTLMRHFEMYTMKEDETIDEIFRRFPTILNGLGSLDHELSKAQNNLKLTAFLSETTDDEISLMLKKSKQMLCKKVQEAFKRTKGCDMLSMKETGHFKVDCPKLKNRWHLKKKKILMAIWEDLDNNEQANICLMADIAPKKSKVNSSSSNEEKIPYYLRKIEDLKLNHPKYDQIEQLFEVEKLKEEIACSKTNLAKFFEGSKLHLLLKNKRHPFDKTRIGYDNKNNKFPIKRCFVCNSTEHVERCHLTKEDPKRYRYQSLKFSLLQISLVGKGKTSH